MENKGFWLIVGLLSISVIGRFVMFIQSGEINDLLFGIFWLNLGFMILFSLNYEKHYNQIFPVLGILAALIFDLVLINYLYFRQNMIQDYSFFVLIAIGFTVMWIVILIGKIGWKNGNSKDSDSQ